jgi:rSAM/selenodomain-associated transferase 1
VREEAMTIALGIMCKAPRPGHTKTRLAAVIGAEQAAALSGCFLRDVADTIAAMHVPLGCQGYGVYAPSGAEVELQGLLPTSFRLLLQEGADFGKVLATAARRLLTSPDHDAVVLINSDSPTLPPALLAQAVEALRRDGDRVVLGPATDGGYTLIGVKRDHPELFADIPWSTSDVFRLTLERAASIALAVETLPIWYDIDDALTLQYLRDEITGSALPFALPDLIGGPALATRTLLAGMPV